MNIKFFMVRSFLMPLFVLGWVAFLPAVLPAQRPPLSEAELYSRWMVNGSGFYQFPADLDGGGQFSAARFLVSGRWSHRVNEKVTLGAGLRYAYDDYSFSGENGALGKTPWGDVHLPDLSLAVFYRTDNDWRFLAAATGGFAGESGADAGDSLIYGGILSASRKISSNLTLGLGAGIYRRFEETSFFPILIVRWQITPQWSVGNALQAGPTGPAGLELAYRPGEDWGFGLGGAYRSVRFRLDKNGPVPGGIGSERSIPVWLRASKQFTRQIKLDLYGGLLLGGELKLENTSAHELASDDYKPVPFLALNFSWRL